LHLEFIFHFSKLKTRVHEEQEAAASHLLKSLPIFTAKACDPAYRAVHQYAANSLDEFFSWPLAKQRASEVSKKYTFWKMSSLDNLIKHKKRNSSSMKK
jgi:hypothetical protein